MIKNNFRILKKQYAYLQTILKTPVKFQKDWPKTVGGVADTRMVVGADGRTDGRTDRQTDRRTDTQNFGGYNIIPRHFLVAGHNKYYTFKINSCQKCRYMYYIICLFSTIFYAILRIVCLECLFVVSFCLKAPTERIIIYIYEGLDGVYGVAIKRLVF